MQEFEQAGGIEEFEVVVGFGAVVGAGCVDDDDGELGVTRFELTDDFFGWAIAQAGVQDDAVEGREATDGFNCFGAAVGGDDVEFCGFDDELASGDVCGELTVYDEEAGPGHPSLSNIRVQEVFSILVGWAVI